MLSQQPHDGKEKTDAILASIFKTAGLHIRASKYDMCANIKFTNTYCILCFSFVYKRFFEH